MSTDTLAAPMQYDFQQFVPGDRAWGSVTDHGLKFHPTIEKEEWLEVMKHLCAYYEATEITHLRARFLLGDALAFGEDAFGEEYSQAIDQTRKVMAISAKTVENSGWIARSIPEENRHDSLTFSHHEVVAKLPADKQSEYLQKAEDESLTVSEFKKVVKADFPSTRKSSKKTPVDGKEYTENQVKDAFEILLTYFQPLSDRKAKATDEQKATFGVQSEELAKILAKLNK